MTDFLGPDMVPTQEGVFDIPDELYFPIKAVSSSALKKFRYSPAHVKAYEDKPATSGETFAMREGTGFHWRMLQPEKFDRLVVADLTINKNKTEYKDWKERQDAGGKLVLPQKTIDNIEEMCRNAHGKRAIMQYLQSGWAERALLWLDPEFGLWMKCKVDWICADGKALVDLKKAQSAAPFGFQRAIYRYDYNVQAYHYLRGFRHLAGMARHEKVRWCWLVSEAEPPCESNLFVADAAAIDEAGDDVETWYQRYAECTATGEWPGYADEPIFLGYEFEPINDDLRF